MTATINSAALREQAEERHAQLDADGDIPGREREAIILTLLDGLEQAHLQIANQEHNVRTAIEGRTEVIDAARTAHDVLANSRYIRKDRVARRILRPYIEEPGHD